MTTNTKYKCVQTYDVSDGTYFYVRLMKHNQSSMSFAQNKNILEINFNLWLEGRFTIPNNLLVMNVESNIGRFNNITLRLVRDDISEKKYNCSFIVDLGAIKEFEEKTFLEQLDFKAKLDINQDVFNNSGLSANFEKFL